MSVQPEVDTVVDRPENGSGELTAGWSAAGGSLLRLVWLAYK